MLFFLSSFYLYTPASMCHFVVEHTLVRFKLVLTDACLIVSDLCCSCWGVWMKILVIPAKKGHESLEEREWFIAGTKKPSSILPTYGFDYKCDGPCCDKVSFCCMKERRFFLSCMDGICCFVFRRSLPLLYQIYRLSLYLLSWKNCDPSRNWVVKKWYI